MLRGRWAGRRGAGTRGPLRVVAGPARGVAELGRFAEPGRRGAAARSRDAPGWRGVGGESRGQRGSGRRGAGTSQSRRSFDEPITGGRGGKRARSWDAPSRVEPASEHCRTLGLAAGGCVRRRRVHLPWRSIQDRTWGLSHGTYADGAIAHPAPDPHGRRGADARDRAHHVREDRLVLRDLAHDDLATAWDRPDEVLLTLVRIHRGAARAFDRRQHILLMQRRGRGWKEPAKRDETKPGAARAPGAPKSTRRSSRRSRLDRRERTGLDRTA